MDSALSFATPQKLPRKAIYHQVLPSSQKCDFVKDKEFALLRPGPEITGTPESAEFQPSYSKPIEMELLEGKNSDAPILRKIVSRRRSSKLPKNAPSIFDMPTPLELALPPPPEPPPGSPVRPPSTKRIVKRRARSSQPTS